MHLWIDTNRLTKLGNGSVKVALVFQSLAEVIVRSFHARLKANRLSPGGNSAFHLSFLVKRNAIVECFPCPTRFLGFAWMRQLDSRDLRQFSFRQASNSFAVFFDHGAGCLGLPNHIALRLGEAIKCLVKLFFKRFLELSPIGLHLF
jgi:hypothetical protein